ncbi:MAG: hypothetical protein HYZ85_04855 [Candidatus Omnitrophica bacterium]|nr:hypothetical protein [Candidatus Omnitrophota bacterium]
MRNIFRIIGLMALALGISQMPAFAEFIQGEIAYLDSNAREVTIRQSDATSGQFKELKLTVPEDVKYEGLSSLEELKVGDYIEVEASGDKDAKTMEADSIKLGEGQAAQAPESMPIPQ